MLRALLVALVVFLPNVPRAAAGAAAQDLSAVAFMSGCWRGAYGSGGVIEERYGPADGGLMVGTTRFLRDGRVVQFEFATLAVLESGVVLTPYPDGERSEHSFLVTATDASSAVFEAPEHDYPKRIAYRLDGDGTLTASIDGGADDPEPRSWRMRATDC